MVKWNKRHIELWGKMNFLRVLSFFTQYKVRSLFGITWD